MAVHFLANFCLWCHEQAGISPTEKWGRKLYWPRELLEQEFRAVLELQKAKYPLLKRKSRLVVVW